MKNVIIAAAAVIASITSVVAPAQAGEFYGVIENDFAIVNKGITDSGLSTVGLGWADVVGDDSILSVELTNGVVYTSDEVDYVIKAEAGFVTFLGDSNSLELSLENIYNVDSGVNAVIGETKVRIGL